MNNRITWVESKPLRLTARIAQRCKPRSAPLKQFYGLTEGDLDPVHEWCKETNIGRRTGFDTFRFRNKTEMSLFLLRWDSR